MIVASIVWLRFFERVLGGKVAVAYGVSVRWCEGARAAAVAAAAAAAAAEEEGVAEDMVRCVRCAFSCDDRTCCPPPPGALVVCPFRMEADPCACA